MRWLTALGLLIGLSVLTGLVVWQGFDRVVEHLVAGGWPLALLLAFYPPNLLLAAIAWRLLMASGIKPSIPATMLALWAGRSAATWLPVSKLGAAIVKVRMLMHSKVPGAEATASAIVNNTVQGLTVVIWTVVGIAALVHLQGDPRIVAAALGAAGVLALALLAFILVQRAGFLHRLTAVFARVTGRSLPARWIEVMSRADAANKAIYENPRLILCACALRLMSRILRAGEIWLAAYLIGFPISVLEAVMLRSVSAAFRAAVFFVPGGFGVQEGALMVLGAVVGHPPDAMLSISLATRVRRLLVGIPGLVAWQAVELRGVLKNRSRGPTTDLPDESGVRTPARPGPPSP